MRPSARARVRGSKPRLTPSRALVLPADPAPERAASPEVLDEPLPKMRASQVQPDDESADAARVGAPEIVPLS